MRQANTGHFDFTLMIDVPIDIAYTTARDDIHKLTVYLPNIVHIKPVERKTEGDRTYIVNKFQGRSILPDSIGEIIKVPDVAWLDKGEWLDTEYTCNWRYEPFVFTEYLKVSGTSRMSPDGTRTSLRVTGDIYVNFLNYPLIPARLKDKINVEITKALKARIHSNFAALIKGIAAYAADTGLFVPRR